MVCPSSVCPSSISAFDQLNLHSLQSDLFFSSIIYLWWGTDGKGFSWKSNETLAARATQGPKDFQWEHNAFSFDRIFLKVADDVDMDKISDKFEKLTRSDHSS